VADTLVLEVKVMYIPKNTHLKWRPGRLGVYVGESLIVNIDSDSITISAKPEHLSERIYTEALGFAASVLGGTLVRVRGRSYLEVGGDLIPCSVGRHATPIFANLHSILTSESQAD